MSKTCEILNFNGKKYILVDRFEFRNKEYLYIIEDKSAEIEKYEHPEDFQGNIEINFLTKCEDGEYETVVDDELFQKLLQQEGLRNLQGKNQYIKK